MVGQSKAILGKVLLSLRSTAERGYLRDITGNRRFWIVKVRQAEQVKNWSFSADERDQIWA